MVNMNTIRASAIGLFLLILPVFVFLQPAAQTVAQPAAPQANKGEHRPDTQKVLRYAFEVAETSFDPIRISDVYSNIVNSGMFDAPLRFDPLARPLKLQPNTTVSLPEISSDHTVFTFKLRPGIYFAPHEVFGGKKRELIAEDYIYSMKRVLDPALSANLLGELEDTVLGAEEAIAQARKTGRFDYDKPIEGFKVLDRYTFQVRLVKPKPIFVYLFTDCRATCAVAREVVERYGLDVGSHPVGTGAYRLVEWRRSSRMVLEANPNFREEYYRAEPAADDAFGQSILATMRGKRLPQIHRIEIAVIEERQPRWLSFLNNEFDLIWILPEDFATVALPNKQLAPNLQKLGVQFEITPALDIRFLYFNMEDRQVGGYTPEKVALRRAISLGYKVDDEINIILKGMAIPAFNPYSPGVAGYDPNFRSTMGEYNPSRAKALLDMYGYLDRDGDGYREMPDGSPFVLKTNSTPNERDKQLDELWKRSMDAIGIKMEVRKAKWPDLLKESNAGKLMVWFLGGSASTPDANTWLQTFYSPNAGFKGNRSRFKNKRYDELFELSETMADSPERTKVYQEMTRILAAYAPQRVNAHRLLADAWYPYVLGFRRPLVQSQNWWMYADIDVPLMKQYEAKRQ
jgi:ABC-type transport system substrate-binding protein